MSKTNGLEVRQPKVSVVMPVFNTQEYVGRAIQSIVQQDLDDWELILVNDGSTDGSLTILQDWINRDSRLRLINQKNQGLSGARNTGISAANGVYVYFMDSDDILCAGALSRCAGMCDEKSLDFVFFNAEVFSDEIHDPNVLQRFNYKRKFFPCYRIMQGATAFEQLIHQDEFFSSACLIFTRLKFLESCQLRFERGIIHEDQLFTALLFLNAKRICYIPESFFLRRVRHNSIMTTSYSLRNVTSYFSVARGMLSYAARYKQHQKVVNCYISQMLNAAIWQAHTMTRRDRLWVFFACLREWTTYIRLKTFLVLLFKKEKTEL
ncbi:glycosyltransferase involved in cell wall biosynthesis [Sphingobacterium alimentarium]|uniref:Glycosyltransferase involved in cell wall biosynthesis n=1 Tax=Sphingobacterium alimentarium TaxID=797292 RepID=A0A4R3VSS9_9SPHI|nr:glycosyltransferase [Sphingobacterium alimentarium]TCV08024.1 glycosyltransferase involved in cell wall biosynthesis [Sphingobacterium alimentarium]